MLVRDSAVQIASPEVEYDSRLWAKAVPSTDAPPKLPNRTQSQYINIAQLEVDVSKS